MFMPENIGLALMLTTMAGLATGIGSAIAYFIRKPKMIYLSFSLGFSAGVMIYISFMELLPKAIEGVGEVWGIAVFFIGIAFIGIIDMLVPKMQNPHHVTNIADPELKRVDKSQLMRSGLFTALAIGIHNFPEGLATFAVTTNDVKLGVITAIAIAIHNIPEGISVSVPILYATGNRNKAFTYSFLSGLAEPIGTIIGLLILWPFLSGGLLAALLAFVSGIMIYISLDELLPMAHQYGHSHIVILGLAIGMFIMALSLLIL